MLLIAARVLQYAGALVLLGSSVFQLYGQQVGAAPLSTGVRRQWPQRVLVISATTAVVGTILWVMAETVLFSGEPSQGTNPAAVWVVFSSTRFGHACLWRIGILFVAVALSRYAKPTKAHWILQSVFASVIVATFAWTGHGAATHGWAGIVHAGGDILHLWAAGIWFGALVPLAILIVYAHRTKAPMDAGAARFALDRFSGIGTTVVVTLAVTGLVNSWFLIGIESLQVSLSTGYVQVLMAKLGLFALMLLLAAANRFRLAPRLRVNLESGARGLGMPLRALRTTIVTEIAMAALLLIAVGVLGTLPPPAAGV